MITLDSFTVANLSEYINSGDKVYGHVANSGIFPAAEQIFSRTAIIDELDNGELRIATARPLGDPGDAVGMPTATSKSIVVPHFPALGHVSPADVAGARSVGMDEVESMSVFVNRVLDKHKRRFEISKEALMSRAIQGVVTDGAGATLFNAYTEFGITQQTSTLPTSSIATYAVTLSRMVEDGLFADMMDGVTVFCSPLVFDAVLAMAIEEDLAQNFSNMSFGTNIRRDGLMLNGVKFVEHNGKARTAAGTQAPLIADGYAYAVPSGNSGAFRYLVAPPTFNDALNMTAGYEYYSSMEPGAHNIGYSIHSQANMLPICVKPGAIVKVALT